MALSKTYQTSFEDDLFEKQLWQHYVSGTSGVSFSPGSPGQIKLATTAARAFGPIVDAELPVVRDVAVSTQVIAASMSNFNACVAARIVGISSHLYAGVNVNTGNLSMGSMILGKFENNVSTTIRFAPAVSHAVLRSNPWVRGQFMGQQFWAELWSGEPGLASSSLITQTAVQNLSPADVARHTQYGAVGIRFGAAGAGLSLWSASGLKVEEGQVPVGYFGLTDSKLNYNAAIISDNSDIDPDIGVDIESVGNLPYSNIVKMQKRGHDLRLSASPTTFGTLPPRRRRDGSWR